jgi:hypothetical protein
MLPGMTNTQYHTQPLAEMSSSTHTPALPWSENKILLISTFWVAVITDLNHSAHSLSKNFLIDELG